MIRLRGSGDLRYARVSATWTLSPDDLAGLLISAEEPHGYGDLREMSRAAIEEAIRGKLARRAEDRLWWRDRYQEEYPGEPTAEEVFTWASRQIAKL